MLKPAKSFAIEIRGGSTGVPTLGVTAKMAVLHAARRGLRDLPMLGYVLLKMAVVYRDQNSPFAATPGQGRVL